MSVMESTIADLKVKLKPIFALLVCGLLCKSEVVYKHYYIPMVEKYNTYTTQSNNDFVYN